MPTLIVEDGSIVANANAFVDLSYFATYCGDRGLDVSAYTDTQKEQAIIRATDFLNESLPWAGLKVRERNHQLGEQPMSWPRTYLVDEKGFDVLDNVVPEEVKKASCELAFYELGNPRSMAATYTPHSRQKAVRLGPISVTYETSNTRAEGARPQLLVVRDLISQFLERQISNISGGSVRA